MLIDPEHFVGEVIFWDSIAVIESSLRSPANMKSGLNIRLGPVHDVSQFIPIFNFFKRHLLYGSARNDQTIEFFFANIIKREVVIEQMLRVCVLGLVSSSMEQ